MSYHFLLRWSKIKPGRYITIVSDIIFLNNNCKFKKLGLSNCMLTGMHHNFRISNPPHRSFSMRNYFGLPKEGRQSSLLVKG
jgi:hypothetical protein